MITLSPALLIAAASALVRFRADGASGASLVEYLVRGTGQPAATRWDAALIYHAGYWSHYDDRTGMSSWPLPATADCEDLARFAREENVLSYDAPEAGQIFLQWSPARKAFVHSGIVVGVELPVERMDGYEQYECRTIEGNVTETGRLDGTGMGRVSRFLAPSRGDRTIRWIDLEHRAIATRFNMTARMQRELARELGRAA
jgi:hypothetical protein